MILFVLILGMILMRGAQIADSQKFSKEYMSISNTNIIKGIFVLLVLLGHLCQNGWGIGSDIYHF